jgi:hypothetical protein
VARLRLLEDPERTSGWGRSSVMSVNAPGLPAEESMTGGGVYPVGLCVSTTGGGRVGGTTLVMGCASGDRPAAS